MRVTSMDMLTSTKAFRLAPHKSLAMLKIATKRAVRAGGLALGLTVLTPVQAQSLPEGFQPQEKPMQGHSAVHYGLADVSQQEASIRSVLSSVQLDRPYLQPSLVAEGGYFLVQMFLGGGGAPSDIADPRSDIASRLKRE